MKFCVSISSDTDVNIRAGVFKLLSSTNTIGLVVLPFASEHRHEMPTRTSTVYKKYQRGLSDFKITPG
jgi:hypothetical protein